MKSARVLTVLCGLLLAAAVAVAEDAKPAAAYQPRMDKDGYEVLFDGKDLNAWDYPQGVWAINEQGELYPAKGGRTIFTKQRYCDFVLELDFKIAAKKKSNSGVFLRVHDVNQEVNTGMEIQILDNAEALR